MNWTKTMRLLKPGQQMVAPKEKYDSILSISSRLKRTSSMSFSVSLITGNTVVTRIN